MMTDIERAYKTIAAKRTEITQLFNYANGPQPLRYSTERLREAFDDIKAHFEINWCSVVIDATLDRLGITGFETKDQAAADKLTELFGNLHIDLEANLAHKSALVATEGYIIAWKDGIETELYYNDPRMCEVFYSSEKPKEKTFAAKWFELDDGRNEITLYYPERIEHWQTGKYGEVSRASAFSLSSTDTNPYGVIPVFCLKTPGELRPITTLQDAINKLFADMMVSAEFGAFVQRYVISQSEPGQLKNGPNMVWWIPAGDGQSQSSSVGQFTPTALNGYLDAMDKLANAIAIITRTPKHYLMTTGANMSGEALLATENPLVRKVKTRRLELTPAWQDIAVFLLKLDGVEVKPSDITVIWERAESIQPYTEAQTRQLAINSGIPLVTMLKREGWTDKEIETMQKDAEDGKSTLADNISKALADAQRKMDATRAGPANNQPQQMMGQNGNNPA